MVNIIFEFVLISYILTNNGCPPAIAAINQGLNHSKVRDLIRQYYVAENGAKRQLGNQDKYNNTKIEIKFNFCLVIFLAAPRLSAVPRPMTKVNRNNIFFFQLSAFI